MPTNGSVVLIDNGSGAYGVVFINDYENYVVDSVVPKQYYCDRCGQKFSNWITVL